jgi:hypothetical protein
MPAPRVRASKSVARRQTSHRFVKRRQEVIAFEAWQRHAGDSLAERQRAVIAKR